MPNRDVQILVEGYSYTEGPRWHNGEFWFVDFYLHTVNKIDAEGQTSVVCTVDEQPSGLGWLPDGRLIVVSMHDRRVLRLEHDGTLVEHANLNGVCIGFPNDMVVAPNGNAYVGDMGFDIEGGAPHDPGSVILVRPDGSTAVVGHGLSLPNGMAVTEDERVLIVNELLGNRISQFDILEDGTLGPRRDFADFGAPSEAVRDLGERLSGASIAPDGLALDAEGAVWVADTLNERAIRVAEGGEILEEFKVESNNVIAMTLGGEDRKTLYICVSPDYDAEKRKAARESGIAVTRVSVGGAGTP